MTELYIPQPGERVRVTAVYEYDPNPGAEVGDVITVADVGALGSWPLVTHDWIHDGRPVQTFCRVEPVEKREEPAPELACYCGHAGCHQCDRAPEPAEPERHFCACGAEAWPRNGSVPLDYYGRPICSDCSSDQERVCLDEGTLAPLDTRIREAQPVYELGAAWSTATDES